MLAVVRHSPQVGLVYVRMTTFYNLRDDVIFKFILMRFYYYQEKEENMFYLTTQLMHFNLHTHRKYIY